MKILQKALKVVKARRKKYGPPVDNFDSIWALWEAYMIRRGLLIDADVPFCPRDVCNMMTLTKVARDAFLFQEDNQVDIAGYADCAGEVT